MSSALVANVNLVVIDDPDVLAKAGIASSAAVKCVP